MAKVLLISCIFLIKLIIILADGLKHDWDYVKSYGHVVPSDWHLHYPACAGERQSPIDIVNHAIKRDYSLHAIQFINFDLPLSDLVMQNDGRTMKVSIPEKYNLQIRSPSLSIDYRLDQFHFHWPSEHAINGRHLPLEMHLVSKSIQFYDNDTISNNTGLVVISVMFDYNHQQTTDTLKTLISHMMEILLEGKNTTLHTELVLSHLLPSQPTLSYIKYSGSLTTPPCFEVVEFFILTHVMPISESEVKRFMSLQHEVMIQKSKETEETIDHNDRPLQKLNGRVLRFFGERNDFMHILE